MVYSNRFELDLYDVVSGLKISISVKSYDEKTAENYWNCYVAKKRIVSKLSKLSFQHFDSTNWKLEWRLCTNFMSL